MSQYLPRGEFYNWASCVREYWHDKKHWPFKTHPAGLLPIWFKTQLVVSGGGRSPPLPYADQRFCHHIPKTSPCPLWPGGLNLAPAKVAAVSENGQFFWVIHHQHFSRSQSVKETSLSDHLGATLTVTPTPPERGHWVNYIIQSKEMSVVSRITK